MDSPWSPCGLLEMLNVVLLKSMESPQSPHGLHGDSWRVLMESSWSLWERVGECKVLCRCMPTPFALYCHSLISTHNLRINVMHATLPILRYVHPIPGPTQHLSVADARLLPTLVHTILAPPLIPTTNQVFNQAQAETHSLPRTPCLCHMPQVLPTESSSVMLPPPGTAFTKPSPNGSKANGSFTRTTSSFTPIGNTNEVAPANTTTNVTFALDVVRPAIKLRHVLKLRRLKALTPYKSDAWEQLLSQAGLLSQYHLIPDLHFGFSINPFQSSLFSIISKPAKINKFHVLQNYSFPYKVSPSFPNPSVNSFINSDDFPTTWGTFTITCLLLHQLPPLALKLPPEMSPKPTRPSRYTHPNGQQLSLALRRTASPSTPPYVLVSPLSLEPMAKSDKLALTSSASTASACCQVGLTTTSSLAYHANTSTNTIPNGNNGPRTSPTGVLTHRQGG